MIQSVYMCGDRGRFQVDATEGSFEFGPSRFRTGAVELVGYWPFTPEIKARAHDALISAIIWTYLGGFR